MSIEHKLIPAGEQHVVANWHADTVEALDNLSVTFDDIGKQAWVQGVGHYVLANSDPITWEAAGVSITSFTYTAGTKLLTITDSAGDTYTATIDGLTTAEVAALITAHAGAVDPHGDRAFATAADAVAIATRQPLDSTLTALSSYNTNGSLHQIAADTFVGRTLTGTASQVTVTNGDGVAGNPTISLPASGVTAASYGSSTLVPVLTVNAQGVVTAASTTAIVAPTAFSDSAFRVQDNGNATRQLAFEVSGITAGTTRTWTAPDIDLDMGNVAVSVATTSLKMGGSSATSMSGAYNTVLGYGSATSLTSGTGNTIVGHAAAPTLTSSNNTIMGYSAGSLTTSSTRNTLIGQAAGYLSNAADRTCIGNESGGSCGASCVVVGSLANYGGTGKNTTSIGCGSGAYASGSSGEGWVAVGYQAAYNGASAITASNWVTVGINSGQNQNSPDWVAIGANALRSSTARGNIGIVCIGTDTTRDSTNAYGVAVGYQAGYGTVANNRSDSDAYGIYIGFRASRDSTIPAATALSDCLAIGRSATVSTSNTYILGSSSVGINVGICMITATARLHLPAGAAPVGKAPLKFTSGALQTTAEAGAIEYNNAYYATASDAVRRPISLSNAAVLPSNITVTASPMTYQNATGYNADVIISGGTISSIEFTRDNVTFYTTGLTTGVITLSPSDRVRVTYSVAPTMTLVPR